MRREMTTAARRFEAALTRDLLGVCLALEVDTAVSADQMRAAVRSAARSPRNLSSMYTSRFPTAQRAGRSRATRGRRTGGDSSAS